jgi:hypothetical protein
MEFRIEFGLFLSGSPTMKIIVFILAALCFTGLGTEALANDLIAESWRAHHGFFSCTELDDAVDDCTLCHNDGGSTTDLNPYSEDIQFFKYDQDVIWQVAITAIEGDDSDGDGVTSIVEIQDDCTFPGDPLSVPVEEFSWSKIQALYR